MHSSKINVYDFDGTIYNGDSSLDFFKYCLLKNKKIFFLLPKIFLYFIMYILKIISKENFKSIVFSFMKKIDNSNKVIEDFWNKNYKKINLSMKNILLNDNNAVIVSASPFFLIEPIAKRLKVKDVIASNVSIETGKWLDENCSGENKIKFIEKKYKKYSIENSYGNSYSDRFVANNSKEGFMVLDGTISEYDEKKLHFINVCKQGSVLACIFFCIYFILGMIFNYSYNLHSNFNLFFESDIKRVYGDLTTIIASHYRIQVHPLLLFVQIFVSTLKGFSHDNIVALVLFDSFIGALSVKYLFQTLSISSSNKKINIILALIYGFSFSSLIFSIIFEIYALSAFSFILIWYNITIDLKKEKRINCFKYIGLGVLTSGILLTNISVFIVGIFVLLISKKTSFIKFIGINIGVILAVIALSFTQQFIWKNVPNIFESFTTSVDDEAEKYTNYDIKFSKLENEIDDIYMSGFIAKRVKIINKNNATKFNNSSYVLRFQDGYNIKDISYVIFYVILLILLVKNFKHNIKLNIGLIISLLGMTCLHFIYGNSDSFLYSQNFIYLIILLLGINSIKENKIVNIYMLLFLIYEIYKNTSVLKNILQIISKYFIKSNLFKIFGLKKELIIFFIISLITLIGFIILIKLIRKFLYSYNKKILVYILIILTAISSTFIKLNTLNYFQDKKNDNTALVNYINYDKTIEKEYPDEISSYIKYKEQYSEFVRGEGIIVVNNFNKTNFYFLGLGNRRKYLYHRGILRELDSEKIYKTFDVKNEIIIPNINTILIQEKNGDFYKIIEDEKSVRIIKKDNDEEEVLPKTNIEMKFYDFSNYKFSEILRVVYQEILFNIKDGVLYPNILAYDNVWYRDSAYAAMVLEETDNIDLISDWILSIDEIYDLSNGNEEDDNLGELLYLLSLVTDKDNKMVKKVVDRAEKIAIKKDGDFYINGYTDGSYKPSYQTEWLKFGLKRLNIEHDFKYSSSDPYSNLLWFTDYDNKKLQEINYGSKYPYLGYAQRNFLGGKSKIYVSNQLYPLTWENGASKGKYDKLYILGEYFAKQKVAPTHIWSAAELYFILKNEK